MIRLAPALDCDVLVVGGGPGGAAAAHTMAAGGLDVLIVDRAVFPRDKVCGDFVGPVGLRELDAMGVTDSPEMRTANQVRRAAVFVDGDHVLSRSLPAKPGYRGHGLVVPRERLDTWILEAAVAAGARLSQATSFLGYEAGEGEVAVRIATDERERTLRARLLVGADGSNSAVARQLRGAPPRRDRIMAVRAYFDDVAGPEDRADLLFHRETFPGYTWVFPTGGAGANVGVGMASDTFPKAEERLRPMLLRLIETDPALGGRLAGAHMVGRVKGFPLSTYNPAAPVAEPRVLLVGDAAGLINPINGEGIQYALLSGRWAGEAAVAAAREGFSSAADGYGKRVRTELGADLAMARLIVQIISNRDLNAVSLRVLDLVLRRSRVNSAFADLAGGILAGLDATTRALSWTMLGNLGREAAGELRSAASALAADPVERSLRAGVGGAQFGFQMVHDAVREPGRFAGWMSAVARSALSVGGGIAGPGRRRRR